MKKMIVFTIGATGYPFIEMLWRGYSHWTMEIAGGICFLVIYILDEKIKESSMLLKCSLGALFVTATELFIGLIVNRLLNWQVWDYTNIPFNFLGQICLPYTCLWFLLAIPLIYLCRFINKIF